MKLNAESVFIHPTDTVWGIGASIYSQSAKNKIAEIKGSSDEKPLSIMFTDINILYKSFNFPEEMNLFWLRNFFKLESTLAVPIRISKIPIPLWVTGKSDLVSIRCLEIEQLKKITEEIKAPFFTTSLNLAGLPPIIDFEAAKKFQKNHAPGIMLFGDSTHNLSGRSSTIVFLKGDELQVFREGAKIEDIKKHLKLTGFKIS